MQLHGRDVGARGEQLFRPMLHNVSGSSFRPRREKATAGNTRGAHAATRKPRAPTPRAADALAQPGAPQTGENAAETARQRVRERSFRTRRCTLHLSHAGSTRRRQSTTALEANCAGRSVTSRKSLQQQRLGMLLCDARCRADVCASAQASPFSFLLPRLHELH